MKIYECRMLLVAEDPVEYKITTPNEVARYCVEALDLPNKPQEEMWVMFLNTKGKCIGSEMVSRGTINATLTDPREVFRGAIQCNAYSIILVHNHPSGDTMPSKEDRAITDRLKKCGEILGIALVDHLIIGDGYYSFKEHDCL